MNTRRENRLEELGRVDAEKAYSKKGKRNLRDEKSRIRKELATGSRPKTPKWPKGYDPRKQMDPKNFPKRMPKPSRKLTPEQREKIKKHLLKTGGFRQKHPKKDFREESDAASANKGVGTLKQRSQKAGGGIAQRGLGRAFMKGGKV